MENKIKQLREKRGLTLYDLENKTGIGYNSLWKYENGKNKAIPLDNLIKIAEVLDYSTDELLGHKNKNDSNSIRKIYTDDELIKFFSLNREEIIELEQLKKMAKMPTLLFEAGDISEKDAEDLESVLQNIFITSIKRRRKKEANK
ncbi:helix-turn-helix domain-containing protein [Oceanivirga miroungae]|uniref:HTH cro/C1-type domain-containing protein n=1 Tax=Oceanivirga miroungae TaxID=1130046 RepID=A0A6I8MBT3_9FUSO|nr:helix-turn-helix transcriptional regulator [Oceanivirga miroungae]VWL84946.1 hypothetical protein OMES3154_00219 [Oceanivirga miroungae]